ncbi:MAG: hypothetical protein HYZ28_10190 [Myxococcales bacterium]|nr:hypothetical protein [Myxococcales bacterium]
MAELVDCLLIVEGRRFGASSPEPGNAASSEVDSHAEHGEVTVGVRATEVSELRPLEGRVGLLTDLTGKELERLRLERVNPSLSVVVGRRLH